MYVDMLNIRHLTRFLNIIYIYQNIGFNITQKLKNLGKIYSI